MQMVMKTDNAIIKLE